MNTTTKAILAYIDEDDIERSLFRLIPLMDEDGCICTEAAREWPDDGALRIVPDRKELITFKDRMRQIGHFCLLDLRPYPLEANKIRTNKNFRHNINETNQYVVYSDTIHSLPDDFCYEIVTVDSLDNIKSKLFSTPKCYYLVNETYYDHQLHQTSLENGIYSFQCPDGIIRQFFIPKSAEHGSFDMQAKRHLTSTSSYTHSPQKLYATKKSWNNSLVNVVESQIRSAKYENDISTIAKGAALHYAINPLRECEEYINQLWKNNDTQESLLNLILTTPGLIQRLKQFLAKNSSSAPLFDIIQNELVQLESERLMLIMQIENAKTDLDAYKVKAFSSLSKRNKAYLDDLNKQIDNAKAELEVATQKTNEQLKMYDTVCESINQKMKDANPASTTPSDNLTFSILSGIDYGIETLKNDFLECFSQSKSNFTPDECTNILILLSLRDTIQITSSIYSCSVAMAYLISSALGLSDSFILQDNAQQQIVLTGSSSNPSPIIVASPYIQIQPNIPIAKQIILANTESRFTSAHSYRENPWPILSISDREISPFFQPQRNTVKATSLRSLNTLAQSGTSLSKPMNDYVSRIIEACKSSDDSIPEAIWPMITRYLEIATPLMIDGFTKALDFACAQWLLPSMSNSSKSNETVFAYFSSLPTCSRMLSHVPSYTNTIVSTF